MSERMPFPEFDNLIFKGDATDPKHIELYALLRIAEAVESIANSAVTTSASIATASAVSINYQEMVQLLNDQKGIINKLSREVAKLQRKNALLRKVNKRIEQQLNGEIDGEVE